MTPGIGAVGTGLAGIDWTGFAIAVLLVELTPGPNMAWLANVSLSQGRRAGLAAIAGVALGLIVNAMVAAAGSAAIAAADPLWWQALRYGGTALMLWLAWQAWREAGESSPDTFGGRMRQGRNFWTGFATNLLNPKAFLFYAAVLPQFLSADAGWAPPLMLAAIGASVASAIHLAIVLFAAHAHGWVSDPSRTLLVRRLLALSLVGVAIWMFIGSAR